MKTHEDKMQDEIIKNRMANFEKLSEELKLGHYLWHSRFDADLAVGNTGFGEALHNVASLVINVYRNEKLRKKLEALIAQV